MSQEEVYYFSVVDAGCRMVHYGKLIPHLLFFTILLSTCCGRSSKVVFLYIRMKLFGSKYYPDIAEMDYIYVEQ